MRALSSSAAIVPALRSARSVLFRSFAWEAYLRIALAAVIAESMVVSFRYETPHLDFGELPTIPPAFQQASGFRVLEVIAGLLAVNLVLLGWYAVVRMRIAIFQKVVHPSQSLRAGWRNCARPADRLYRATLATTFGIVALLVVLVLVIALGAFGVITLRTSDGKYDVGVFLIMFFPTVGFAVTVVAACVLTRVVLHDFILPHMALENAAFRDAWREVRRRVRNDREGFFSYLLMRALLVTVIAPLLALLAFAVMWPVFWGLGAATAGYNALLDDATGWAERGRIALNVILLVAGLGVGATGAAMIGGPFAVFLRAHAVYWYGSRYKALGDALSETVKGEALSA
jgi:hypothetical protein